MSISLEIVPRNWEALSVSLDVVSEFSAIEAINIPDLSRFPIRSWEAAVQMQKPALRCIPHIRANDFSLDKTFPYRDLFRSFSMTEILVIAGDPLPGKDSVQSSTVPFIKKLKMEMPELQIYAAFDPYRSNIKYELDYLHEKEAAGACGFFTQPFFDIRLLELYAEYLENKTVYWGIAPVLSESSRKYWESRNRAIFPRSFTPTLEWNWAFARQFLDRAESLNLYLMPIKVDLHTYLTGLFS
ncbi:methylenetetrahydrofolate reductase [Spirochaetia bacterium]|nr:methylenetetrahydrofolate reductase [Spirochaetia bacterium]GHU36619.1 methylenetetrahydrofolate reductase [Spirochaetia bacterium]